MKEILRNGIVAVLIFQAKLVLKKYKPKLILVTGSVGKTSTKDALYDILSPHVFVRKSEKSFNSDIGVPLTILGLPNGWGSTTKWLKNIANGFLLLLAHAPFPRWLVVEVGADRPGDVSKRLNWLRPDIVVTTAFPDISVHVEFYDSPEAVIREEFSPVSFLKQNGALVYNGDDKNTLTQLNNFSGEKIRYGFIKDADVRALRYRTLVRGGVPLGVSFEVAYKDKKINFTKNGVVGKTHVYAVLASVASALMAGIDIDTIQSIEGNKSPNGRLKIIEGKKGTIIDDTYNSSPAAVHEALEALSNISTIGKKIAVLGDMMELGEYSKEEHIKIGKNIVGKADVVVTVGVRAKTIIDAATQSGMLKSAAHSFEKKADAIAFLLSTLEEKDIVLIKGSQSMRLEVVVKALMAHPQKANELLVRQDAEWLTR